MRTAFLVLILAPCLLACRQLPKMDTSSSAALTTSSKEVAGSLSAADAKRFRSAMRFIAALELWEMNPSLFARALELGPTPVAPPSVGVMKRAHGRTAKEVIALADELAAETQRIHGLTAADVIAHALKIGSDAKVKPQAARARTTGRRRRSWPKKPSCGRPRPPTFRASRSAA